MDILDVIALFQDIATRHFLISSYDVKEGIEQQLNGEDLYPKLTLELPFNIAPDGQIKVYHLALLVLDITALDQSDEFIIIDKCQKIAEDIEEYLIANDHQISNVSLLSIQNSFNDNTSGFRMEFDLTVRKNISRCYLPFNN